MVDEDDWWSLIEATSAISTTDAQPPRVQPPCVQPRRVQPPRKLSRAARFAIMDGDDDGDNGNSKNGRKPIAYGRMKDIVSPRRRGDSINGDRAESSEGGEDDDEGGTSLLGSYDGSLASIKHVVFPLTITDFRHCNSRPAKKLFDSAALSSSSPTHWMTPAELDAILSRTKGWKKGTGGTNNKRRGGRRAGKKESYCFDGKLDWGKSIRDERCRVSPDNTAFKDELFGLAIEEHRSSLLFKRAFLC